MLTLSNLEEFVVIAGDQPVTDSRRVAHFFGREHADILKTVRRVLQEDQEAKGDFSFCLDKSPGRRPLPWYQMNKDGFMLLAMNLSGPRAAKTKRAFIRAFNAMAEFIRTGLWQRRIDAELAFVQGAGRASLCGRELATWRVEKPRRLKAIADLDRQMQLPLEFAG